MKSGFNRLHSLRMENDAARYAMEEMRPRFERMARRHENGTAPRAVVVYQLFQTPPDLAARMAELLDLKPGLRILEPSAGLGRLLDALRPHSPGEVVAVEQAADCARELFQQERQGVTIKQRDFLTTTPQELGLFDAVIMNPPFHLKADILHIKHAMQFLKPGGKLAAICMDGHLRADQLKPLSSTWEQLPASTFKESGTAVNTIILTIPFRARDGQAENK